MKLLKKGPVTQLKEEVEKLKQNVKVNYENYLRALAEFDNFRRRKEREIEEFKCFANENLMIELIPILENFDRALAHCESPSNSENLKKGFEIVYRQLKFTLEKFGLKEYSCLDKEFDPKTCEAVSFIETNDKPQNIIVQELSKGYQYQNRVIRPSRVIVSKPLSKPTENQKKEEEQVNSEGTTKGV